MSHDTPTLKANLRERTGTRYAQRLRNAGQLPGVIYGHGQTPVAVSIDEKEVMTALHHGAHVLNLEVDGHSAETCLVKDLQFGFLGDNVIHIDFARVRLDEEVTVLVHLHFTGESEAMGRPGAIVSHDITELEVVCAVNRIPEEIRVDQSTMKDTLLTVGEIELPEGVLCPLPTSTPVVHVNFVHADEAEGEEVEVEGSAEPEVITEKKDEESSD
ncbi:MAG: 50S ribosomal protein L25 [Planctomycetota bacterium]|jgi:large subunit ribosomal protein L25